MGCWFGTWFVELLEDLALRWQAKMTHA